MAEALEATTATVETEGTVEDQEIAQLEVMTSPAELSNTNVIQVKTEHCEIQLVNFVTSLMMFSYCSEHVHSSADPGKNTSYTVCSTLYGEICL
jgi:hypothetical protein